MEEAAMVEMEQDNWEERAIGVLNTAKIDKELSPVKKGSKRKHKLKWMRRPVAVRDVILELLDDDLRECALRALSSYLVERRKEEPENYKRTGFLLFNSCSTMCILLQEVLLFYSKMDDEALNSRLLKRFANVLTLFQCIAANPETRQKFIKCQIPVYLLPVIVFQSKVEIFDNIRAIALSVIGILCQCRGIDIIIWALENGIPEVCKTVLAIGNELSKVVALHITESILTCGVGLSLMCHPDNVEKIKALMDSWNQLVIMLAGGDDFSPRLLYHILRCYYIVCAYPRGVGLITKSLSRDIIRYSFLDATEEYPVIGDLLNQLLICVDNHCPSDEQEDIFEWEDIFGRPDRSCEITYSVPISDCMGHC